MDTFVSIVEIFPTYNLHSKQHLIRLCMANERMQRVDKTPPHVAGTEHIPYTGKTVIKFCCFDATYFCIDFHGNDE